MTTIPDVLRLVPGVQVAQINGNKWAVSVRGFNSLYANKLLVLVDGRSVYNRLFSGVLWDAQDLLLDDIDRIEVTRGPGAALWGANAVNGVINIISKSSAVTPGGLVRVDAGSGRQGAIRYGGLLGATPYRVHAQWTSRNESRLASGAEANDTSSSLTTGFRADWGAQPSAVMLEGAVTAGRARALFTNLDPRTADAQPISRDRSDALSGHVLGRWTRTRANGASLQVQSFVDLVGRQEPVGDYNRHAAQETGSAPRTQWQVRSVFAPVPRAHVSLAVFYVGPVAQLQIEAYTRTDATVEWRLTNQLSFMAIGHNLLRGSHPEFDGTTALLLDTEIPRAATLRFRWTFR